ncbi:hypothetical protein ElyMa_001506800 [Elysia marginata]|uniref:Uncharacterized protein n=1 Tax=Elysia marginata TaxID=1093978 RepID=A0AAV4J4W0_9GAST|nr:hypothetical protein ElyMa_001506800 [Elysia marginata]
MLSRHTLSLPASKVSNQRNLGAFVEGGSGPWRSLAWLDGVPRVHVLMMSLWWRRRRSWNRVEDVYNNIAGINAYHVTWEEGKTLR